MTQDLPRYLVPSAQTLESQVGDEMVLLHLGNSTYYGLDPVGTRIWSLLKEGMDLASIRACLVREFDAPAEVIGADMESFLSDLQAHGIVEPA